MKKGFRTFQPNANAWDTKLYFPTPLPFLEEWRTNIAAAQQEFANLSIKERAAFLQDLATELFAAKDDIQLLYCQESGLPKKRFQAEFERTFHTIRLFADYLENARWEKTETLEQEKIKLIKRNIPIGPVLVLGSSNFPLAYSTLGGDTVAAFAAGCCVVLKAHPMHVGTSSLVATCISKALDKRQLSPYIFSHVLDDSYHWASTFAKEPAIKAIGFTGSIKGGRALMDIAAQRPDPIPVFAEMGSLNPVIISQNLDATALRQAAEKLALSIYTDAGQFCTKPGLILVH
jgi:NADP-dependent aldehyde dehydrogenase